MKLSDSCKVHRGGKQAKVIFENNSLYLFLMIGNESIYSNKSLNDIDKVFQSIISAYINFNEP